MNRKTGFYFVALAICSMILFGAFPGNTGGILVLLSLPFSLAGKLLRALSLSGTAGNLIAIFLYAALCVSPLLLMLRRKERGEDWLLLLASGMLFYVMYLMVNPGLMPIAMNSEVGRTIYSGAVYSVFLSWAIMKLLRHSDSLEHGNVYRVLRTFLTACAVVWIIAGFGVGFGNFRAEVSAIRAGNTMPGQDLLPTYLFRFLIFGARAMEYSLDAMLMLLGVELLRELEKDPYSDACCTLAEGIAKRCRGILAVLTLTNLGLNLGQTVWASRLYDLDTTLYLPLFSMALVFGTLALTKLLAQGRKLKEDNGLFI